MKGKTAVIIGGGFAGLAVSALLALRGFRVILFERNKDLGGRARVMKKKGFSFDMGPSWYMMPEVFEEFFARFGYRVSELYKLVRLDPRYEVVFEDGTSWMMEDDVRKNAALFEKVERGAGKKLLDYLTVSENAYRSALLLLDKNIWDFRTWFDWSSMRAVLKLFFGIPLLRSWESWLERWFADSRLRKVIGFPAVFLGGSPYETPSLYSILSWADFGRGIWYPMGGMGKVVEALARVAREKGVEVRTDQRVERIVTGRGRVKGVMVGGELIKAEVVVGAGDLASMEMKLLQKKERSFGARYWRRRKMAIGALMLYLGLNKRIKRRAHHLLYFSDDWRKNFEQINDCSWPDNPSMYISIRSITDRSIVRKGGEELVVLVPLGATVDYKDSELEVFKGQVEEKLKRVLGENIFEHIVVKEWYTPKDFLSDYEAYKGTALGLAHTTLQSLWLRPGNRSSRITGLYYVGQYTNPGVGVPMALISALITERMINEQI